MSRNTVIFEGFVGKKNPEIEASLGLQVPDRAEIKLGELEQQLLKEKGEREISETEKSGSTCCIAYPVQT